MDAQVKALTEAYTEVANIVNSIMKDGDIPSNHPLAKAAYHAQTHLEESHMWMVSGMNLAKNLADQVPAAAEEALKKAAEGQPPLSVVSSDPVPDAAV